MKILFLNASDIQGGAARAAYRLHSAILAQGEDCQMLVQSKYLDDFTVLGPSTKFKKAIGKMRPTIDSIPVWRYKEGTKALFSPSWLPFSCIPDMINKLSPDIVHFHWIAGGLLSIEDIAKIKAPIIWSLHDMWAFTGGCHYDDHCAGYQKNCGSCPVLGSNSDRDLSRKIWIRKQTSFAKLSNITIIGLSKWLADCAISSKLFEKNLVLNLPNPIDTKIFSPFDQDKARNLLNLPQDKKLILFGAISATSDPRKGYEQLVRALDALPEDYELVVFGSSKPKGPKNFKQNVHYLGQIHDDISLRVLYSAADVMVVPSLQENLSNAIMESLACGNPVVGFEIGGNSDLIEHEHNGYLAKPYNIKDLAYGINWVLQHDNPKSLGHAAREKVLKEFDSQVVSKKYIELYKKILEGVA
jgi:glycosyltransferase involved in cell wall biosynthesis